MHNYLDLTGKTALVTGASSGIGAATALVLADLGAAVAIGYHNNQKGADEVAAKIASSGGKAVTLKADMRHSAEVAPLVARAAEALGPLDILVNNAGSLVARLPLAKITEAGWDEIMDLNLKSAMLCSQAVAPAMVERKSGAIVNVVSIAGRNGGGPGAGAYAAAKAGLIAFTKSMAKELAPNGVRVNAISPGVIDTPFHEVFSTPEMIAGFVKGIPLGRIGTRWNAPRSSRFLFPTPPATWLAKRWKLTADS